MTVTESVSSKPTAPQKADRYVSYLSGVCRSSGPRAQLRRSIRKEPVDALTAHRYVARWVADDAHPELEAAYYCVAALFAEYSVPPAEGEEAQLSKSFGRWIGEATTKDKAASVDSIISRLHHLVRLDGANVRSRLPYLISALGKQHRDHLPWARLVSDLSWWEKDERVAKRWLQDFYRVVNPDPDLKTTTTDNSNQE